MVQDYNQWVIPDPTLGGLFPAITTDAGAGPQATMA